MTRRTGLSTLGLLLLGTVALAGCATSRAASPPKPIADVTTLAGVWRGTLEFGAGEQPCTLTIEPGGRATLVGRTMTVNGQVAARDGKGSYSFPGRSDGDLTLYESDGRRQLHLKGVSGVFDVWVTPSAAR